MSAVAHSQKGDVILPIGPSGYTFKLTVGDMIRYKKPSENAWHDLEPLHYQPEAVIRRILEAVGRTAEIEEVLKKRTAHREWMQKFTEAQ